MTGAPRQLKPTIHRGQPMSLFDELERRNVIRMRGFHRVGARRDVADGQRLRPDCRSDATIDIAATMSLFALAWQEPP